MNEVARVSASHSSVTVMPDPDPIIRDRPLATQFEIVDAGTAPADCRECAEVPLEARAFEAWAATIESATIKASRWSTACVAISVRNIGEQTWTPADQIRVGTSAPRDSGSPLVHPGWTLLNRPVSLMDSVPPGGLATLEFPVAAPGRKATTQFELVADGSCWIPNTKFVVAVGRRRPAVAVYVLDAKRSTRD